MGRQSAGNGFLRAAVAARGEGPVTAFTPFSASAAIFRRTVASMDPHAPVEWISAQRLDLLAQNGLLYRPDQVLGPMARQRLRVGPAAYSLCGVTHTLATHTTLDAIAKIVTEPVMPWDALVCTSRAALSVVSAVLDHEADYLRWRTGLAAVPALPLLPVIPLGVHTADFDFSAPDREAARARFGLAASDVVALCAGRLSIGGKAHPYPTFRALQAVAVEGGQPLVLLMAGQAYNPTIAAAFEAEAAATCPDVRVIFVDGKDAASYRSVWGAADFFVSLADSIQETFGLTPLEAMAAGLPALVSDWNGYRDTVRDGIDGFRVPTWAPSPGGGEAIASDYESGLNSYEAYLYRANTAVAVDMKALIARLRELVASPDVRRRLGAAGQERARTTFDWSVVFRSYQSLWAEQSAIRRAAQTRADTKAWLGQAPRSGADHMGPFETFASYSTHHVTAATSVSLAFDLDVEAYKAIIARRAFPGWNVDPPIYETVRNAMRAGPSTVGDLSNAIRMPELPLLEVVVRLAKLGVLALGS
ncbi:glycosyltransferase family 4 protein [Phenylobacterium sp.]|uniref:glycosyltransferase family 4 protein n=1 Tax=Phenylobacterium sp. TaxID=1871053 RepID=UPI0011F80B5F|nr:glycosyltransferase family 4 protein [Phenylobacterium sp.]THD53631.1 MAG: glycosyltransferase [Phenylobacterium sp.]